MRLSIKPILTALVLTVGLSGLAMAQPGPPPYPAVPALRAEIMPPPPHGRRMVWEPGHWHWNGAGYVWIGGRYARPGRVYANWVHGQWVWRGGHWVWAVAHWE